LGIPKGRGLKRQDFKEMYEPNVEFPAEYGGGRGWGTLKPNTLHGRGMA